MAQRFQPGALWNSQRQLEPDRGCLWSCELTGQLAKVCSIRSKIELLTAGVTRETAALAPRRAREVLPTHAWNRTLTEWSREVFNVAIWLGPGEVSTGDHALSRFREFPEARELSPDDNEKSIAQMQWLFRKAKEFGMRNFLYTTVIHYTQAFE